MKISFTGMFNNAIFAHKNSLQTKPYFIFRPTFGDTFEKSKNNDIDDLKKLFDLHNKDLQKIC